MSWHPSGPGPMADARYWLEALAATEDEPESVASIGRALASLPPTVTDRAVLVAGVRLHGSIPVAVIGPTFTAHPVFHLARHVDPIPTWRRARLGVPLGDRGHQTATACGVLLSAMWWTEPDDWRDAPLVDVHHHHGPSYVDLRLDQAASFARPCRRCPW